MTHHDTINTTDGATRVSTQLDELQQRCVHSAFRVSFPQARYHVGERAVAVSINGTSFVLVERTVHGHVAGTMYARHRKLWEHVPVGQVCVFAQRAPVPPTRSPNSPCVERDVCAIHTHPHGDHAQDVEPLQKHPQKQREQLHQEEEKRWRSHLLAVPSTYMDASAAGIAAAAAAAAALHVDVARVHRDPLSTLNNLSTDVSSLELHTPHSHDANHSDAAVTGSRATQECGLTANSVNDAAAVVCPGLAADEDEGGHVLLPHPIHSTQPKETTTATTTQHERAEPPPPHGPVSCAVSPTPTGGYTAVGVLSGLRAFTTHLSHVHRSASLVNETTHLTATVLDGMDGERGQVAACIAHGTRYWIIGCTDCHVLVRLTVPEEDVCAYGSCEETCDACAACGTSATRHASPTETTATAASSSMTAEAVVRMSHATHDPSHTFFHPNHAAPGPLVSPTSLLSSSTSSSFSAAAAADGKSLLSFPLSSSCSQSLSSLTCPQSTQVNAMPAGHCSSETPAPCATARIDRRAGRTALAQRMARAWRSQLHALSVSPSPTCSTCGSSDATPSSSSFSTAATALPESSRAMLNTAAMTALHDTLARHGWTLSFYATLSGWEQLVDDWRADGTRPTPSSAQPHEPDGLCFYAITAPADLNEGLCLPLTRCRAVWAYYGLPTLSILAQDVMVTSADYAALARRVRGRGSARGALVFLDRPSSFASLQNEAQAQVQAQAPWPQQTHAYRLQVQAQAAQYNCIHALDDNTSETDTEVVAVSEWVSHAQPLERAAREAIVTHGLHGAALRGRLHKRLTSMPREVRSELRRWEQERLDVLVQFSCWLHATGRVSRWMGLRARHTLRGRWVSVQRLFERCRCGQRTAESNEEEDNNNSNSNTVCTGCGVCEAEERSRTQSRCDAPPPYSSQNVGREGHARPAYTNTHTKRTYQPQRAHACGSARDEHEAGAETKGRPTSHFDTSRTTSSPSSSSSSSSSADDNTVCAAGPDAIVFIGAPGSGKSTLARALYALLVQAGQHPRWLNQDEVGNKKAYLAAMARVCNSVTQSHQKAKDSCGEANGSSARSPPCAPSGSPHRVTHLILDKINLDAEMRADYRGNHMRVVLWVAWIHPDGAEAMVQTCLQRIAQRGEAHRTLRPRRYPPPHPTNVHVAVTPIMKESLVDEEDSARGSACQPTEGVTRNSLCSRGGFFVKGNTPTRAGVRGGGESMKRVADIVRRVVHHTVLPEPEAEGEAPLLLLNVGDAATTNVCRVWQALQQSSCGSPGGLAALPAITAADLTAAVSLSTRFESLLARHPGRIAAAVLRATSSAEVHAGVAAALARVLLPMRATGRTRENEVLSSLVHYVHGCQQQQNRVTLCDKAGVCAGSEAVKESACAALCSCVFTTLHTFPPYSCPVGLVHYADKVGCVRVLRLRAVVADAHVTMVLLAPSLHECVGAAEPNESATKSADVRCEHGREEGTHTERKETYEEWVNLASHSCRCECVGRCAGSPSCAVLAATRQVTPSYCMELVDAVMGALEERRRQSVPAAKSLFVLPQVVYVELPADVCASFEYAFQKS